MIIDNEKTQRSSALGGPETWGINLEINTKTYLVSKTVMNFNQPQENCDFYQPRITVIHDGDKIFWKGEYSIVSESIRSDYIMLMPERVAKIFNAAVTAQLNKNYFNDY